MATDTQFDCLDGEAGVAYLTDMMTRCAQVDAATTLGRWMWHLEGVLAVGESLVQAEQMEEPVLLSKVYKLIKKVKDKKKDVEEKEKEGFKDTTRKRKRPETRSDDVDDNEINDLLGDESLDEDFDPKIRPKPNPAPNTDVDPAPKVDKPSSIDARKTKAAKRCVLELAKVWPVTPTGRDSHWNVDLAIYLRSLGDDVLAAPSAALQTMLVYIFSIDGVANAAKFAASLRESSSLMTSALAGEAAGKQIDSSFAKFGEAVKTLLSSQANDVVAEGESLMLFAKTGELLQLHIQVLCEGNTVLKPQYEAAYTQNPRAYGSHGTAASYRVFIILATIASTYGAKAQDTRPVIERHLKMAEVIFWLQVFFGNGVFAMLVGSSWKKMAFDAWDSRAAPTIARLASASPSLILVAEKANTNIWAFFNDPKNPKIPLQLKYDTHSQAERKRISLLALLSNQFEDVIEEPLQ